MFTWDYCLVLDVHLYVQITCRLTVYTSLNLRMLMRQPHKQRFMFLHLLTVCTNSTQACYGHAERYTHVRNAHPTCLTFISVPDERKLVSSCATDISGVDNRLLWHATGVPNESDVSKHIRQAMYV